MASGWIKKSVRYAIYKRDNHTCAYCAKKVLVTPKGMNRAMQADFMRDHKYDIATLDHIIPQSDIKLVYGNSDDLKDRLIDPRNIITVCNECNSSKKSMDLREWCKVKGYRYDVIRKRIARRINKPIVKHTTMKVKATQ
jgi:5-methylcytosine-specific restriction endonuclease McrA